MGEPVTGSDEWAMVSQPTHTITGMAVHCRLRQSSSETWRGQSRPPLQPDVEQRIMFYMDQSQKSLSPELTVGDLAILSTKGADNTSSIGFGGTRLYIAC